MSRETDGLSPKIDQKVYPLDDGKRLTIKMGMGRLGSLINEKPERRNVEALIEFVNRNEGVLVHYQNIASDLPKERSFLRISLLTPGNTIESPDSPHAAFIDIHDGHFEVCSGRSFNHATYKSKDGRPTLSSKDNTLIVIDRNKLGQIRNEIHLIKKGSSLNWNFMVVGK